MNKTAMNFKMSVLIIKEGKKYIAFTPALDISTSGKTKIEAKKHFEELLDLFFSELVENNTFDDVLKGLGWSKQNKKWFPPVVVSSEMESISVCA